MENKGSNQTIICDSCNAEFSEENKFCTECGKPVENVSENDENPSDQKVICPKCHAEMAHGIKFCEECGTKIESQVNHTTCPKCYEEVAAGETFCTKCGTSLTMKKTASSANINQELKKQRESNGRNIPPSDETLDSVVKTGKGLMKGLGGFLDKATSGIDKNLQSNKSGSSSNKNINERIKQRRPKEKIMPGFLVCNACGGYYELQPDEDPDDFSNECECGGKLEHKSKLE